jgi:cephalosporin hydroxylase
MGQMFRNTELHLHLDPLGQDIFVEIGSDIGEGSTDYFANLAAKNNRQLLTVDIANREFHTLTNVEAITATGSDWAKTFGQYNKEICCLYLDNFDYDWDVNQRGNWHMILRVQEQIREYLARGVVMNNLNCQAEHLAQMLALLLYMAKHSVVVCDDTYKFNDCYLGKCGAVIPLLHLHGYHIVEEDLANGIILVRNSTPTQTISTVEETEWK